MAKRTCAVPGCERTYRCSGYCAPHYTRFRRTGDPGPLKITQRVVGTPEERFWPKVTKTDSCWLWNGAILSRAGGYGNFNLCHGRGTIRAHVFAYQTLIGPVPEGMVLDHTCHTPACVNPEHLRPATREQNNQNHNGRPYSSNKTSRFRGVTLRSSGKWWAQVRNESVGYFATELEAAEAARRRRIELFTHNDLDRIGEAS